MPVDKKTGWMIPAEFPCYRGLGLCKIRRSSSPDFICAYSPSSCGFQEDAFDKVGEPAPEKPKTEIATLWDQLESAREEK